MRLLTLLFFWFVTPCSLAPDFKTHPFLPSRRIHQIPSRHC